MKIKSITVSRKEAYEIKADKPGEFKASICISGDAIYNPSITIHLTEEQIEPIVGIIAQVVAQNMEESAKAFHQEVQAMLAGPAIEQEQIEDNSTSVEHHPV